MQILIIMLTQCEGLKKQENNTLLMKFEEFSNLGIAADIIKK